MDILFSHIETVAHLVEVDLGQPHLLMGLTLAHAQNSQSVRD